MKSVVYILTYNSPRDLAKLASTLFLQTDYEAHVDDLEIWVTDQSTDPTLAECNRTLSEIFGFEYLHRENHGFTGGRMANARLFHQTDYACGIFLEDDLYFMPEHAPPDELGLPQGFSHHFEKLFNFMERHDEIGMLIFSFQNGPGFPSHATDWSKGEAASLQLHYCHESRVAYAVGDVCYTNRPMIIRQEQSRLFFAEGKTWSNEHEIAVYSREHRNQVKSAVLLNTMLMHHRIGERIGDSVDVAGI